MKTQLDFHDHDLRMASIHEAGHVVIAQYFGIRAYASISPNDVDDPYAEKTFVGETRLVLIGASDSDVRMVALAGILAEQMLDDDDSMDGYDLFDWLVDGDSGISQSDETLAGNFDRDDVLACMKLLHDHWDAVLVKARELAATMLMIAPTKLDPIRVRA